MSFLLSICLVLVLLDLLFLWFSGGLFYTIFRELFSSSSPNKIYGKALEKCRSHPEVISVFGEPVKGYGEVTRRGRRQHVSFIEYKKDGLKHMRVKFYIQGSEPGKQGTVHLEVKENPESGEYEFRYIFVELEPYSRTIVVEDNRSWDNQKNKQACVSWWVWQALIITALRQPLFWIKQEGVKLIKVKATG